MVQGIGALSLAREIKSSLGGNMARALLLARNETLRVYRSSSQRAYQENSDVVKGWVWICSCSPRSCAVCFAMHGTVHPVDEQFASHPGCLVAGATVYGPRVEASATRRYTGEVVEIQTVSGNFLTVTPNHPVLTPRGWIAARLLKEGGNVISNRFSERGMASINPNDYQIPSPIEDVAHTLGDAARVTTMRVPIASEDFHGDGMDGEVCVIRADSELWNPYHSPLIKPTFKNPLISGNAGLIDLACLSLTTSLSQSGFTANSSEVCRSCVARMLRRTPIAHQQPISFGIRPSRNSGHAQTCLDDLSHSAESFSERIFRFTGEVTLGNLVNWQRIFLNRGGDNFGTQDAFAAGDIAEQSSRLQSICESLRAGMKTRSNTLDALTGNISIDRILKISVRQFSGHVYNLQTSGGWFAANNIITHNCRCSTAPVTDLYQPITAGVERFAALSEENQRRVLGPAKFEAYKNGQITLADLVGVKQSVRWGMRRYELSLKDALTASFLEKRTTIAAARAAWLEKIKELKEDGVLRIGSLNPEIVEQWTKDTEANLDVVLTGKQRAHYLGRHPDAKRYEEILEEAVLAPDEVHRNKRDAAMAIFYKKIREDAYVRVAVLMQDKPGTLKHSVLSYRKARKKELESGRARRAWEKK